MCASALAVLTCLCLVVLTVVFVCSTCEVSSIPLSSMSQQRSQIKVGLVL